jgi:uncharacterized protein (DUF305 family)
MPRERDAMKPTFRPLAAVALALAASVACAPGAPEPFRTVPVQSGAASEARVVQPGAPGQATRVVGSLELDAAAARLPHTEADVRFMQGMIPHHAQALEMTALVEARTRSEDIRLLARRIEISQRDEIAQMSRWLEERGEAVPGEHAHHMMGDHALMPGMLSAADMASLRGARGADFDRLFLEHMIRHHEGALVMVRELFATPGAGQESMISVFAAHVEADQRIEIERMRRMLLARP